jgi:hypothetical protein
LDHENRRAHRFVCAQSGADAELCAGLVEAEKGVAAVAAHIASGAAAHLPFGDQQFTLVAMKPCEQTVEGDESGLAHSTGAFSFERQWGLRHFTSLRAWRMVTHASISDNI